MKKTPALELRGVSYVANGKKILDSVNWTVQPGEHWAILGPNGSGKTTLLKIACGYLWPNAGGEVYRNGETLLNLRELRKSIGWVTASLVNEIPIQERVLNTVVSGKFAQIGYLGGYWGQASRYDYACARRYLKELGCEHLREREFGTLSQGEQQKVLIARAHDQTLLDLSRRALRGHGSRRAGKFPGVAAQARRREKNSRADLCDASYRRNFAVVR